jgi:hypothetical protein
MSDFNNMVGVDLGYFWGEKFEFDKKIPDHA